MDEQQRRQLDEQGYLIFKNVLALAKIEGQPGDVLVFNGHCWHAGRPNASEGHRRAVLVHSLRADVPRPQNRRQHLEPDQAAALAPHERELLGVDDE